MKYENLTSEDHKNSLICKQEGLDYTRYNIDIDEFSQGNINQEAISTGGQEKFSIVKEEAFDNYTIEIDKHELPNDLCESISLNNTVDIKNDCLQTYFTENDNSERERNSDIYPKHMYMTRSTKHTEGLSLIELEVVKSENIITSIDDQEVFDRFSDCQRTKENLSQPHQLNNAEVKNSSGLRHSYLTRSKSRLNSHCEVQHHQQKTTCRSAPSSPKLCVNDSLPEGFYPKLTLFMCKFCGRAYKQEYSLNRHLRNKHASQLPDPASRATQIRKVLRKCMFCDSVYKHERSLNRHLREVHSSPATVTESASRSLYLRPAPFKCMFCNCFYRQECSLNRHLREKHVSELTEKDPTHKALYQRHKLFKCKLCESAYKTRRLLIEHCRERHGVELTSKDLSRSTFYPRRKLFNCKSCHSEYKDRRSMVRHRRETHEANEIRHCAHCTFSTRSKAYLTSHIREKHSADSQHFQYEFANSPYEDRKCLQLSRGKYDTTLKQIYYPPCNNNTSKENDRIRHLEQKFNFSTQKKVSLRTHVIGHSSSRGLFECQWCDRIFCTKESLQSHAKGKHLDDYQTFHCGICPYNTKMKSNLTRHVTRVHEKARNFTCTYCHVIFKSKRSVRLHIKAKHITAAETYYCYNCNFSTRKKVSLRTHVIRHRSNGSIFKCEWCNYIFANKWSLYSHEKETHLGDYQIFNCGICPYYTKRKTDLARHITKVHGKARNFTCPYCHGVFKSKPCMLAHIKAKHVTTAEPYCCYNCNFKTQSKTSLESHAKDKHLDDSRIFHCGICPYHTKRKADLTRHITNVHEKAGNSTCNYCHVICKSKQSMRMHIKTKHIAGAETYYCYKCNFSTRKKVSLRTHIVGHRSSRGLFECPWCGHIFSSKTSIRSHIKNNHLSDYQIFRCGICPYRTKWKYDLGRHITRVHGKAGKFTCSYCHGTFKSKQSMSVHIRATHITAAEPYYCYNCNFKTQSKTSLQSHTKEKHLDDYQIFCCEICPYYTQTKWNIARHNRDVHGKEDVLSCKYCKARFTDQSLLLNHNRKCSLFQDSFQPIDLKCENDLPGRKEKLNLGLTRNYIEESEEFCSL